MDEQEIKEQQERLKQIRKEGAKGCLLIVLFMFLLVLLALSVTSGCRPLLDEILNRVPKLNALVRTGPHTVQITNLDTEAWENVLVEINIRYTTKFDRIEPGETVKIYCMSIDIDGIPKIFTPEFILIEAKYKGRTGVYTKSFDKRY